MAASPASASAAMLPFLSYQRLTVELCPRTIEDTLESAPKINVIFGQDTITDDVFGIINKSLIV